MEKHSTISLVYRYNSFVLQPFPVCFTTEQSTVKASSFVKLKAISVIAGLCTEHCNSQSPNISDQQNGKYLIKIIFILNFQLKSDLSNSLVPHPKKCEGMILKRNHFIGPLGSLKINQHLIKWSSSSKLETSLRGQNTYQSSREGSLTSSI